jgi:glutathione peroxidase-family protein
MKGLLTILLTGFSLACFSQTSVYGITITGVNNQQYPVGNLQGKILMIVLLPSTQTSADRAFLKRVDSISLAHTGSLQTIAVPSFEDGYAADSANTLLSWYQAALDTSIIVSQPLYTHKSSGIQQDSLFRWLTDVTQNTHFDDEVEGAGSMFFVDPSGTLYGELGVGAEFSDKAINKVLP